MNEIIAQKLKLLPDSPGCYQMKENGKIIYVGKAVNLKNRVRSYFHGRDHTPKVAAMVSHITDFDILLFPLVGQISDEARFCYCVCWFYRSIYWQCKKSDYS